jgi:geranylgeranyl diphosphate synthase type II
VRTSPRPRAPERADFARYLERQRRRIDGLLGRRLASVGEAPPRLVAAMRYSLLAGGKRLRPILALEACRALGGADRHVFPACAALEMIHTYSLIHDDLPAMDDDRWRRGLPTAHVKFGEALAILSGDALHTLAFQILAEEPAGRHLAEQRSRVLSVVAGAAGLRGMVGGQVRDLESEGRSVTPSALKRIHRGKTGALLTAATLAGGILAGGTGPQLAALRDYGEALGLAFQIVDDILDEEGTRSNLGKSPGKDRKDGKATYPSLFGLEVSRRRASEAVARAHRAIAPLGTRARKLSQLADFVLSRDS